MDYGARISARGAETKTYDKCEVWEEDPSALQHVEVHIDERCFNLALLRESPLINKFNAYTHFVTGKVADFTDTKIIRPKLCRGFLFYSMH